MTSLTVVQTRSTSFAPARACVRHGLVDGASCPSCGAQTYDLAKPAERREVKEMRVMMLDKRRSWPFAAAVVLGVAPMLVLHFAFPSMFAAFNPVFAVMGAVAGAVAKRFAKAPAVARLDEMLEVRKA